MNGRFFGLLAVLGLFPLAVTAFFQSSPGYMDADYYFAGGLRLADGKGFSEELLWNYLDDPVGLPHPSHSYWMPLTSILAACGMSLTGHNLFPSARWIFILLAAAIPPLSAALAWRLNRRKSSAWLAGCLACLPGFYLPFLPVTDAFGVTMLLGGVFFLLTPGPENGRLSQSAILVRSFLLGLIAGLMHLTRADGILWLLVAVLAIAWICLDQRGRSGWLWPAGGAWLVCLAGYGIVMAPWLLRNMTIFGTPLAPGSARALWITSYDEIFIYPAELLTPQRWVQAGLSALLKVRLWAAGQNLQSALAVQGLIFLFPLVLAGMWRLRDDRRVQLAGFTWLMIFLSMTVIFPFQGARGGFFHSGAALQPIFWAAAPAGLEAFLGWGARRRGWRIPSARRAFSVGLCGLALFLNGVILFGRATPGELARTTWDDSSQRYRLVEQALQARGVPQAAIVLVNNAPGFYIASHRPAISIPFGDLKTVCTVAARYQARYLILEMDQIAGEEALYQKPSDRQCLHYLASIAGVRLFEVAGQ